MKKMFASTRQIFIAALIAGSLLVAGKNAFSQNQTASVSQTKSQSTKWRMVSGKGSDFFFAIPENSVMYGDENFYLGSLGRVDSVKTLIYNSDRTILQIDLFEGAAKEIHKKLISSLKDKKSRFIKSDVFEIDNESADKKNPFQLKEGTKNGFEWSDISLVGKNHYLKMQIYRYKDRLYVLKSVTRSADNKIAGDFFESVKLVNENTVLTPNPIDKTEVLAQAKMLLPKAFSTPAATAIETNQTVDSKELDKKAVLVFMPSPALPKIDNKFDRTFNQIRLKVLLLADGKVGSVETVTKTARAIEKEVMEAAKGLTFLPAEKNGKPVSTYATIDYWLAFN